MTVDNLDRCSSAADGANNSNYPWNFPHDFNFLSAKLIEVKNHICDVGALSCQHMVVALLLQSNIA